MELKIKKIHPDAIIPQYQTSGSVGFDLHALEESLIWIDQTKVIRTGIAVEIPSGYEITVRQRSGLSKSYPNYIAICLGTIDFDYRGEILIPIVNHKHIMMKINKGDRIAQAIVSPIVQCKIVEVDELTETYRGSGAFGHTGD